MKIINIQNAKTHLSKLVEEAASGEEIVIAKAGKPVVRLTPFEKQVEPRKLGALAGLVTETEGCWDPDPDLEDAFYGSEDSSKWNVAEEKQP